MHNKCHQKSDKHPFCGKSLHSFSFEPIRAFETIFNNEAKSLAAFRTVVLVVTVLFCTIVPDFPEFS